MKYRTADGGTVEITRTGTTFDMHARDASGRSVATVEMNTRQAFALIQELKNNNL
ncbi:hypothetical protein ACFC3O_31600 [Streptomyces sp. NPDC056007]|uniref:hypothetical protein n=1 Tax=Streptomyces sp. NPDC056007 TaxID=3345678 RepID=UPI0035D5BC0D